MAIQGFPSSPFSMPRPSLPLHPLMETAALPASSSSTACLLVPRIHIARAVQNDDTVLIDDGGQNGIAGFPCPDPSLEFNFPPGGTRVSVPTGASGHAAGFNPDVACHHCPQLTATTATQAGGVFCTAGPGTPAGCVGAIAPAGLGGMIYYPPPHTFLLSNGNATADITVGSAD